MFPEIAHSLWLTTMHSKLSTLYLHGSRGLISEECKYNHRVASLIVHKYYRSQVELSLTNLAFFAINSIQAGYNNSSSSSMISVSSKSARTKV